MPSMPRTARLTRRLIMESLLFEEDSGSNSGIRRILTRRRGTASERAVHPGLEGVRFGEFDAEFQPMPGGGLDDFGRPIVPTPGFRGSDLLPQQRLGRPRKDRPAVPAPLGFECEAGGRPRRTLDGSDRGR